MDDVMDYQTSKAISEHSARDELNSIPVVSYQALLEQHEPSIQNVGNALRDIGFFALIDHKMSQNQISNTYEQIKKLFALPQHVKRACERPEIGGQVGFTSFFKEQALGAPVPDLKEYWHVMRTVCDNNTGQAQDIPENVWPDLAGVDTDLNLGELQHVLMTAFRTLDEMSVTVLSAISVYLGEAPDLLPSMVKDGYSVLRLLHYPAIAKSQYPESVRAAAHEDINFITMLVSATEPGLEILTRSGEWMPVIAPEGAIIVDSADMLCNLTYGLLKATTHRVVNNKGCRLPRFSMPFFVHPRSDVSLAPLDRCRTLNPNGAGRNISASDFLRERLIQIGVLKP